MDTDLEQTSLGKLVVSMLNVKCNFNCNLNFKLAGTELPASKSV